MPTTHTARVFVYDHSRIRSLREDRGWSVGEAAAHIGVHPQTWRDWENGKVPVPTVKLARLCSAFDILPGRFFVAREPDKEAS